MAIDAVTAILNSMKPFEQPAKLPLESVSEIAFEIHLLRSEFGDAARRLMLRTSLDEAALEECAVIDDALAEAKRILERAVTRVGLSRTKRGRRAR
jgi:hypothetical protein